MSSSSYRFARTPRWLVGHALALVGVVAFVSFGFWQLSRLDERRELNATIEARIEAPAEPLDDVAARSGREELEYRRVSAAGEYLVEDQVLLRAQALNGAPGFHVLTPLALPDGTGVIVDRGWIPLAAETSQDLYAPVPGEVAVEAIVRNSQMRGRFGPTDPSEGRLGTVSRVDVSRLAEQVAVPLRPYFLELNAQEPSPAELPVLLTAPTLDEGPHLGYAIQWFSFAGVVVVGYPILLRATAKRSTAKRSAGSGPGEPGKT